MNMQWYEFIFSEEKKYKVLRHLAFWSSWWLYFLLCFFLFQQPIAGRIRPYYLAPGDHLPLKTFLLVLLFALTCYPLIYLILPKIIKGKWLKASGYFVLLCAGLYLASLFLYWNIFSSIDSFFGSTRTNQQLSRPWPAVNLGLMNFVKVASAAAIIKYLKYWWLKQKESQRLEKEKINAELQLLKAQVHPDFLFKTLNNIYTHALSSSPRTSGMLLKLSDLLSYMLYECDQSTVPLEKEIEMMKEYIQLEKIRYNDEPEIQVNIKGDLNNKKIAPFLLLPFIENSFNHCRQMTEQFWINMDIRMEEDNFSMKLTNGIAEILPDQSLLNTNGLANVQKRLSLLYPKIHELKMTTEQEMFIVLLNIRLTHNVEIAVEEEENDFPITRNEKTTVPVLKYASE
jgi:sensor histidine kinase YesM